MAPWIIPAASAAWSFFSNWLGGKQQKDTNMDLAKFQAEANERLLQKQLDYDRPVNQMARFQEAGLNPHLIYGQGSPGNQGTPLRYPDIKPPDMQKAFDMVPVANQTAMTMSQTAALDARTRKDTVVAELNKLQARVVAQNPLLNTEGYKAIIDGLKTTAELKAAQTQMTKTQGFIAEASGGWQVEKVQREVNLLEQRFKLGELDSKIKAQVLQSKEFQNAILEVQKKWLTDADITPQHIYQAIMMLLMKSL